MYLSKCSVCFAFTKVIDLYQKKMLVYVDVFVKNNNESFKEVY